MQREIFFHSSQLLGLFFHDLLLQQLDLLECVLVLQSLVLNFSTFLFNRRFASCSALRTDFDFAHLSVILLYEFVPAHGAQGAAGQADLRQNRRRLVLFNFAQGRGDLSAEASGRSISGFAIETAFLDYRIRGKEAEQDGGKSGGKRSAAHHGQHISCLGK